MSPESDRNPIGRSSPVARSTTPAVGPRWTSSCAGTGGDPSTNCWGKADAVAVAAGPDVSGVGVAGRSDGAAVEALGTALPIPLSVGAVSQTATYATTSVPAIAIVRGTAMRRIEPRPRPLRPD